MRIALGLTYDGTLFHGFQKQTGLRTVQGILETALSFVADQPTPVVCAGRTDKGVHAAGQVCHFDTTANRNMRAWTQGTNSRLSDDVRIKWVKSVDDTFHARFSATSRHYRYLLSDQPIPNVFLRHYVTHWPFKLNSDLMQTAATFLLGKHDFSSFRAADCQAKSPIRRIDRIRVRRRKNHLIQIDIEANAFLQQMVRNIVGALLHVGMEKVSPNWIQSILAERDRTAGHFVTAKSEGLYLMNVFYQGKGTVL